MTRDTVLLLTTSYPDLGDGSEAAGAFVHDLAQQLSQKIPVRVVAPGSTERGPERRGNVSVWRFAGAGRPLSLLSPISPVDWPQIIRVLASMRRQADAAVRDGRVRQTLALWVLPCGWVARGLLRRFGVPYSVWALGSDIWGVGRLPLLSSMIRRVAADAEACYADGLALAADASELGGRHFEFLPSTRRVLPVPREPPSFAPPWRVLFLGRWHPNKGVDMLIDALQALPDHVWARIADVTIAGGGPLQTLVRDGVSQLIESGRPMRLLGFLNAHDAAHEIARADWLVVPSRIESIPIILSDALKAGRPLIVTPVGDMARLVGEAPACGIVTEQVTPASIAEAIAKAMETGTQSYCAGVARAAGVFDLEVISDSLLATMNLDAE